MINVVKTAFSVPSSMPLMEIHKQLGISNLQAKVFHDFYGLRNIAIAQDQVLKNIQSATFNLGDLPSINLRVTSPVKNSNKIYYSVIAGSFRSKIKL